MDAGCVHSGKRRLAIWMMGVATVADPVRKSFESKLVQNQDNDKQQEKVSKRNSRGRKMKNERNFDGRDGASGIEVVRNGVRGQSTTKDGINDERKTNSRKRTSKTKALGILEDGEQIEGPLTAENDLDLTMEDLINIAEDVVSGGQLRNGGKGKIGRCKIRSKTKASGFENAEEIGKDDDSTMEDLVGTVKDDDACGRAVRNAGKGKTQCGKPKRKAKASGIADGEETVNDEDLTLEDLMSIAKEYVKEDKHGHVQSLSKSKSEEATELRGSCTASQSVTIMENEEMIPPQVSNHNEIIEPNMSGDPTQDMLDLFLGPLLKSTQQEEKNNNLISEDMSFAYEMKKQDQSTVVTKEQAPLTMKKKSSLKDKVAMFLH